MENNDEYDTFDEECDNQYKIDFYIKYPKYCSDPELVKNRPDKSVLYINTHHPDDILNKNVINFDEIKTVYLNVNVDCFEKTAKYKLNTYYFEDNFDENPDFYKTLIRFKNLESLYLDEVYLHDDYWIEIFDNLKSLKTLVCTGHNHFAKISDNVFKKIISIPSLEKLQLYSYYMYNFPEVPSNLKRLLTERCIFWDDRENIKEQKTLFLNKLITYKKLEVISFNGRGYNVKISKKERNEAKELLRKNLPNIKYINLDGLLEERVE